MSRTETSSSDRFQVRKCGYSSRMSEPAVPLRDENGPDRDFLVVVVLRTNQYDVQRRLTLILAASAPEHPKADAQVIAREPTANDCDRLEVVFGYDVLAALGWHRMGDDDA